VVGFVAPLESTRRCAGEIKRHPEVETLLVIRDDRAEATRRVLNRPVKAVRQGRHSLPLNNPSDCYPIYRGGITPIAVVFDVPGYGCAELAFLYRSELRRPSVMAKVCYLPIETPGISHSTAIGAHSQALLQASWYR
jgi:hypothetical protein